MTTIMKSTGRVLDCFEHGVFRQVFFGYLKQHLVDVDRAYQESDRGADVE